MSDTTLKMETENKISILRAIRILFINLRIIILMVFLFLGFTILWLRSQEKQYTAQITMLPNLESQGNMPQGQFANFAASFGISGGGGSDFTSLYNDIILSRSFASRLLDKKITDPNDGIKKSILTIYKFDKPDSLVQINYIRGILSNSFSLVKNQNKIIVVSFETFHHKVAEEFLTLVINELERYNKEDKTNKAKENRSFIENRLSNVKDQLKTSESKLIFFLKKNKDVTSPLLANRLKNLQRDLKINEEIYLMLSKQFEMAKIQEVKDKPLIQLLDKAYASDSPSSPKTKLVIVANLFFSIVVGAFLIFSLYFLIPHITWLKKVVKDLDD